MEIRRFANAAASSNAMSPAPPPTRDPVSPWGLNVSRRIAAGAAPPAGPTLHRALSRYSSMHTACQSEMPSANGSRLELAFRWSTTARSWRYSQPLRAVHQTWWSGARSVTQSPSRTS